MLRHLRTFIPVGLLLAIWGVACSRPIAPQRLASLEARPLARGSAPRLFYPLDLGNHWRFHRIFTLQAQVIRRSLIDHDHVCIDPIGGREYVVDRITRIDSTLVGPITYYQWIRARQDPTGLYEADLSIGTPPACASAEESSPQALADDAALLDGWRAAVAPPGESEFRIAALQAIGRVRLLRELLTGRGSTAGDELTRLRYPLVVGRTWTVRAQPLVFTATVEAFENLSLPVGRVPAYRVRIESEATGPQDRVLTWYGHSGMLGMFVHVEIPTDSGPLIAEDVITLEDLAIERGRF